MSSDAAGNDILDQFKNISTKLKKRFLRKPNVTEACESFTALGQHCENIEMPSYAGLCWIAAARCEGSLANIPGETSCLIRSAQNFLSAEIKNKSLGCENPANEDLQAALSCYSHATTRYLDNCPLTVGIDLEIVESLEKLDLNESTEWFLKDAVELSNNSLDIKIHCLELLGSHYNEQGNYSAALDTFTELNNLLENSPINGARSDLILSCEITRILLLLILRPTPQKLAPHLAKLLEKYTWGDTSDQKLQVCGMSQQLFLLIQSLVMTCQSLDTSSLPLLEADLWSHLTIDQKSLLRTLVRLYCR